MKTDFSHKVAVVTGGSDGIGLATAKLLAQAGAKVAICGRRPEALAQAKAELEALGAEVLTETVDVADGAALQDFVRAAAARFGRLDALVNNAMSMHYAPIADLSLAQWQQDFAVNAEAAFLSTQAAMPLMAQNGGGAIVNVGTTNAVRAMANYASYSASKAALVHFSACAAMEGVALGVRVNAVLPGQVNTAATQAFAEQAPELAARTTQAIPMGRVGEPSELAQAIVFLLSDAASYITGVALPVDGGKSVQLYLPSA